MPGVYLRRASSVLWVSAYIFILRNLTEKNDMNISNISNKYEVRKLSKKDAEQVYMLEAGNPLFFEFCPPAPSVQSVMEDMDALPPNKTYDDKFYIGFYFGEDLIAVMDLISHYPDEDTAFIGFFMMNSLFQGRGIGSGHFTESLRNPRSYDKIPSAEQTGSAELACKLLPRPVSARHTQACRTRRAAQK